MGCPGLSNLDPRCHFNELAKSAFTDVARSFATAAGSAADWLWRQVGQATSVNLSSPGINRDLLATGAVALVLCTGLFVVQVITATLRREPGGLVRAVRGLGIATIASAFAITATKLLLAAVDELSDGVVRYATGDGIDGLGPRFGLAMSLAQLSNPAAMFLFAMVVLLAVVMVWVAMMMRKLLLIVAAVMTPLAFAGGAADITRSWVRRWIEFTAALIASKLLLVVILMIGLSVFEGAGLQTRPGPGGTTQPSSVTQAGTQLATGAVLLLMAGLAPWLAIKMFHFAGNSLQLVHAQAAAAGGGTRTLVAAPRKVHSSMLTGRSVGASTAGSGRGPSFAGTAAAPTIPRTSPGRAPQPPAPDTTGAESTSAAVSPPRASDATATTESSRQPTRPAGAADVPTTPRPIAEPRSETTR